MATLSAAQQYLTNVAQHSDPEIRKAYSLIPQVFIDQIFGDSQGKSYAQNYLNAGLVSDSNYNNMSTTNTDFFRVELIDGNVTAAGDPAFKLRITGKMHKETFQMVPMQKGALPDNTSDWLKNFRSDLYVVTRKDVADGLVTEADYQEILEYCKVWQAVGSSAMYTPEHKGNRLSFVARNTAFLLVFDIQVRPNMNKNRKPSDPLWTPGITNCAWSNVHLLHRQGGQTANSISLAGGLEQVAPAPVVDRQFAPVSMNPTSATAAIAPPARNPFATPQ